ncbi:MULTISPECIES: hypothetical protein [Streptomyces]|uniref:Secreted protein n=2 Tax=Streptomyces TaxID=1883 RepID=A0ABS9JMQ0_9ACTN|nr:MULTISPECIES: hypothetical protein [Streptomyces]MYU26857.1 hypothetical protein [Streptomyces sp. SID7810]CUW25684.1 hypothetical protein TUE45_00394 [Streptomyces reticuli]AKN73978.1 hypothetical protein QR97_33430 [Streptomyces sp. PBH53]MCG0066796.1 hypothetical protein [Streptomyces tricolor]OYP13609.1 hypothetical protein CFC35_03170 [Streptomyces sp. FBKL.4005]
MISTRRIVAAVGLAAGVAGLAVPQAHAADTGAPLVGRLGALSTLDTLTAGDIPAPHRDRVPRVSQQLQELKHLRELNQLNQLEQVLAPAAPVLGLASGIH